MGVPTACLGLGFGTFWTLVVGQRWVLLWTYIYRVYLSKFAGVIQFFKTVRKGPGLFPTWFCTLTWHAFCTAECSAVGMWTDSSRSWGSQHVICGDAASNTRSSWHWASEIFIPRSDLFGGERHQVRCPKTWVIFFATKCKPCIECDPEHTFKKDELDRLLEFMRAEGTDSDLKMVKAICTGALHRHPALHGVMSASIERVHLLDSGKTTFRNPKRYLV